MHRLARLIMTILLVSACNWTLTENNANAMHSRLSQNTMYDARIVEKITKQRIAMCQTQHGFKRLHFQLEGNAGSSRRHCLHATGLLLKIMLMQCTSDFRRTVSMTQGSLKRLQDRESPCVSSSTVSTVSESSTSSLKEMQDFLNVTFGQPYQPLNLCQF